jgi:hypothetical protein
MHLVAAGVLQKQKQNKRLPTALAIFSLWVLEALCSQTSAPNLIDWLITNQKQRARRAGGALHQVLIVLKQAAQILGVSEWMAPERAWRARPRPPQREDWGPPKVRKAPPQPPPPLPPRGGAAKSLGGQHKMRYRYQRRQQRGWERRSWTSSPALTRRQWTPAAASSASRGAASAAPGRAGATAFVRGRSDGLRVTGVFSLTDSLLGDPKSSSWNVFFRSGTKFC